MDFLSVIIESLFTIGDIEFITKKLLGVFEGVCSSETAFPIIEFSTQRFVKFRLNIKLIYDKHKSVNRKYFTHIISSISYYQPRQTSGESLE